MLTLQAIPYVPGQARGILRAGTSAATPETILLLRQSELAALMARPAGIVLLGAAPYSHPALRLLSQGIPTVLAEEGQLPGFTEGMEVLLDGQSGLLSSPVRADLPDHTPPPVAGGLVNTRDGSVVELRASVGNSAGAATAMRQGAASIGLVRTEYLFPADGSQPDAHYLAGAFEQVCRTARPLSVTFRLVDIAGDKRPPWLANIPGITRVLGLQGARLYSIEPVRQVYLAELEALARLTPHYRFKVLLPYIVSVAELEALASEVRHRLPQGIPLGAMLETPAAALAVREFLDIVDFTALGCNDLMQCLFAADRDQPELRAWLDPHAPVLYRFLDMVTRRAGSAAGAPQVCGLLAERPGVLPVLLGLGYRVFSVDPVMLPWLAQTVQQTDMRKAMQLAREVCEATRPEQVSRLLA